MQNARKETPPTKADRYRRMAAVLARHGIGAAFEEQRAVHIREACEELGTTFIKLGQMLSMRADLLPADVRAELAKLRDDVPPVEYAGIESVIVEELGASPELVFTSFDKVPLACASIAQAHLARLSGGRTVVVKVQKPGVREEVEADLQILRDHAHAWTERFPVLADFDFPR